MTMQPHPAVAHPDQNYPGMSHAQLKALVVNDNNPGVAYQRGDDWNDLAGQLRDAASTLDAAINGSRAHWEGAAADLARGYLAKVRDWSADTAQHYTATASALHQQVDAAAKAKSDMPDPVDFDPATMLEQAAANPIAMIALPATMFATYEASNSAKDKAIQVVQTRDASMRAASASIPAFVPPPDIGDGGAVSTAPAGVGPSGYGAGVAGYHGTGTGGGGGGGYDHYTSGGGGGGAGYPNPGSGAAYGPTPVGQSGGPTRIAGYSPTTPPAGYTPGFGTSGGGSGVAGGFGAMGGDSYAGGGSACVSTSPSSTRRPGVGSSTGASATDDESAQAASMGMGGVAGRGGKKDEDKVRKRPTFLVETDDVFGDGQLVAPTVIGENPAGDY